MLIRLPVQIGSPSWTQLPKATVSRHVHVRRPLSTRLKGLITSFPLVRKRRAGAATLTCEGRDRPKRGRTAVSFLTLTRLRG